MHWIVIFEDSAPMKDVRHHDEAEHLAHLPANSDDPEANSAGVHWVRDGATRERACELAEQDRYFVHRRRGCWVLQWGKALPGTAARL